ncbi:MAG: hypothetical protein CVU81_01505 [Euryarchaeota archaeon HGW-Euryarchaeota-1]|nr:MAG: hypothetical protein CVU81_01505 [Euryarchaeota archaeon HGW-Euryarchaeota-1]
MVEITDRVLREISRKILDYVLNNKNLSKQQFVGGGDSGLAKIIYDGLTKRFSEFEERAYKYEIKQIYSQNQDGGRTFGDALKDAMKNSEKNIPTYFSRSSNAMWLGYKINEENKKGNNKKIYYTLKIGENTPEKDIGRLITFVGKLPEFAENLKNAVGTNYVAFKVNKNPLTRVDSLVVHYDDKSLKDNISSAVNKTFGLSLFEKRELRAKYGFDVGEDSHSSLMAKKMAESYFDIRNIIADIYVKNNKVPEEKFNKFVEITKRSIIDFGRISTEQPNYGVSTTTLIIFLIFISLLALFAMSEGVQIVAFFLFLFGGQ